MNDTGWYRPGCQRPPQVAVVSGEHAFVDELQLHSRRAHWDRKQVPPEPIKSDTSEAATNEVSEGIQKTNTDIIDVASISSNRGEQYAEANRLQKLGFRLCALHKMSKRPVGDHWQKNPVTKIEDSASGYGMLLAANDLCSLDPDNVEPAREGLARCGFDLDELMMAGVRTTSTRPGSGGRSTFRAVPGLRWIKFASKAQGTILELRAASSNLQDCLPGTVYLSQGEGPYEQQYANGKTMDEAPELPGALQTWWLRMSQEDDYLREQQKLLVGHGVQLAVSAGDGKLAFASIMRMEFNAQADVVEILERHAYSSEDAMRWAPRTASGAPCVREIPGKDGLWQSDHASDPLHGTFDAWTAYVVLDHDGDVGAAEESYLPVLQVQTADLFDDVSAQSAAEARAKFDAARREHQRRENIRIGEGDHKVPSPEIITLVEAISRYVFLSDGSRVADVFNPHYDLAYVDWAATHAASKALVPQLDIMFANGKVKKMLPKAVQVSTLWKGSKHRKTAICRTFKADGGLILPDPQGRLALNTWRPYVRTQVAEPDAAGLPLFLDHVQFLFGADADRFLDWLAHIEQKPGELPHTGWLHIAREFGMGRNWLAGVLTRVWAGSVASNLDLVAMLKNGFNGQLSRKMLAVVDEIREGGRDSQWEHAEKLKSVITEETRLINPKYGRQTVEFNACRWLMFSNHLSAIPMDANDRRFEVVSMDKAPRGAAYYKQLYALWNSSEFVAAVAQHLGQRDIRRFNAGGHAKKTEAKMAAAKASQTPMAEKCEMLVKYWPSDLISSSRLYQVLDGQVADGMLTAAHRRTLEQFGVEALGRAVKVGGKSTKVSILRNKSKWKETAAQYITSELERAAVPFGMNAAEYLLNCETAEGQKPCDTA